MALEFAVVLKDIFTPSVTSGCSTVLQQSLFGFVGALTQRASEDSVGPVESDTSRHVGHFPLLSGQGETERGTKIQRYRSEEHTSELQSHSDLVCRLLLEKKKK